ncbi:MAG TPA: phosphopantetheine-binding protein [Casimicrobiaceae bacterium]|nr:phosphopantetheine-binding protein [Casimicrobiaceae bacterium]
MTSAGDAGLRAAVFETLQRIAPEISPDEIVPARPLRDQVDLDSMDWLNFLVGLHERLGIEIPESDYRRLVSLDDLVAYLRTRIPA